MKETLTTGNAAHILFQDENANWSYKGAHAMIEYLEQIEEDTGDEFELDQVAIRCDYSEWSDLDDWYKDYYGGTDDLGLADMDDDDDREEAIREYIQDNGTLIEFQGGIIVSSF